RQTIQGRRLARGHGGRNDPRAQGDKELEVLRHRNQRSRHQPGVLAGAPGGDQHATEAETISGLGNLGEIAMIDGTGAFSGAQVLAVTMGRQEPEDIEAHGVVSFPEIVIVRINPGNSAPQPSARRARGWVRGLGSYWAWASLAGGTASGRDQITSLIVSFLGISFRSVKVSAIFCC